MNGAYHVGAIGLSAQQRALDAVANNITNMNTPAFKRGEVRFAELVGTSEPIATAAGMRSGSGGVIGRLAVATGEPGELERTGRPLDLAIDGRGFVELMGGDGQLLLWRGGQLKIGDDGLLATETGIPLRAAVTVPDDVVALTIGRDGIVSGTTQVDGEAIELGQIELVRVDDPLALTQAEGGVYRVADGTRTVVAAAGEDGMGALIQGAIERSNVQLTDEMVRMMLVQRAYAASAQVVQTADQLAAIANGLRS